MIAYNTQKTKFAGVLHSTSILCICVTITLSFYGNHSKCQEITQQVTVNVSYFGKTISHPGLKIGIEYPLMVVDVEKLKKSGVAIPKTKSIFLTGNLIYNHHRRYNSIVLVNTEIGYRITRKKGFKMGVLLGFGGLRTIIDEDTYQVSDQGKIKLIRHPGQWGFAPSLSFELGKDMGFQKSLPWAYHLKPSFYFQIPYNHSFLMNFVLEFGVSYRIINLLKK